MRGKISHLPSNIRDQVNRRLDDGQPDSEILPWLNSLPEVQAVLKDRFEGVPISPKNLSEHRKRAFRQWQLEQSASEFVARAPNDPASPHEPSAATLIDRLVHWVCVRFAAAANDRAAANDPEAEIREIRPLLADIIALRRGELVSRRIALEQQRLQRLNFQSQQELEKLFWEWTQRPDIHAKLFPNYDPDKLRSDVVRLIDHKLLGVPWSASNEPALKPNPAPNPIQVNVSKCK